MDHKQSKEIKENNPTLTIGLGICENLRLGNMADKSKKIVPSSLHTTCWYPLLCVILGVVQVAILHVRNIQPGYLPVVAEDTKVGVCGDDAALEEFLTDNTEEWVRSRAGIGVHQPWVTRTCLEHQLSPTTATRLKVHEGSHLLGPDMLRNKPVGGGEHVLLRTVEQEDDVVLERHRGMREDLQDLEHDGAGHGVITGACNTQ